MASSTRPSVAIAWRRLRSTACHDKLDLAPRPTFHAGRTDHPAGRPVDRPVRRRSRARGPAAGHRRRAFRGRLAADEETVKYTVVLTASYPPVAREILAPEFDVIEHPTEHQRSEDDVITLLAEADAAMTLLS